MAPNSSYSEAAFGLPGDPADISIYESDATAQGKLITTAVTENSLFEQHITTTRLPRLRIISIHSKSSVKPLQISRDALEKLKNIYDIGSELWDLTSTFGNKPLSAAAGDGGMTIQDRDNGIRDISYRLTFPVPVGAGNWDLRQVGVFQRYDPKDVQNLWIFFHAKPNTPVQTEIEKYATRSGEELSADETWFTIHSAVLSSYLHNWRSYIDYLGHNVDRHIDRSLYFISRRIDRYLTAESDDNLAAIHNTRNRLLPTPYRLRVTLDTLTKLAHLSSILSSEQIEKENGFQKLARCATYHQGQLSALVAGIEVLKEKINDALNMIELGLNFRMTSQMLDLNNRMFDLNNRMLSANEQLLHLGNKSFDDNATVKVVTIVTLIYLPANLVSSILGMNLFKFDDGTTDEFTISKEFWIFIAATIILAIITIGIWYFWTHKEQVIRRKSRLLKLETSQGAEKDAE